MNRKTHKKEKWIFGVWGRHYSQQDCLSLVNGANLDQALKHIVAILMCDEVRQFIVDFREH